MIKIIKKEYGDKIFFDETPELKEAVYQKVLGWYIEQNHFSGEGIMQADNPQIEAPVLLSDIADDLFKFEYKEQ